MLMSPYVHSRSRIVAGCGRGIDGGADAVSWMQWCIESTILRAFEFEARALCLCCGSRSRIKMAGGRAGVLSDLAAGLGAHTLQQVSKRPPPEAPAQQSPPAAPPARSIEQAQQAGAKSQTNAQPRSPHNPHALWTRLTVRLRPPWQQLPSPL
ncbi:hypothetical protein THAOC_30773, partial [Thalassiosira oceanica]